MNDIQGLKIDAARKDVRARRLALRMQMKGMLQTHEFVTLERLEAEAENAFQLYLAANRTVEA